MGYMRLSELERKALKTSLTDFEGEVYLFGSRLDPKRRGGDIDILLKPRRKQNALTLKLSVGAKFMKELDQSLDVVVYHEGNAFCQEIMKYAQRLDPQSL